MTRRALLVVLCCGIAAACGRNPSSTPAPGERISGSERLGWDQQASDAIELASFRYAIYVDGVRSELADVACTPTQSSFTCSARLPVLTAGAHTLELASFITDVAIVESAKSAPLRVTVGAAAIGLGAPKLGTNEGGRTVVTSDGVRFRSELIVDGLNDPTDLAFAPDGRIFIAERGGRVRLIGDGHLEEVSGLIDDVDTRAGGGLLALSLAPDFARTGHVFVVYTATGVGGDLRFRVARFREVNGTLGERAVLLDEVPAAPVDPRAVLRFGRDHKLYVAFDDGGHERASGDWASYSGKVLRLNADGTTPPEQASPIILDGLRSPRGMDWAPSTATLWLADARPDASQEIRSTSRRITLPPLPGTAAIAFYRGALMPGIEDNMLVAGGESGQILRLRFTDAGAETLSTVERVLEGDNLPPLRVVAVSPRGETYFCTETALSRIGS